MNKMQITIYGANFGHYEMDNGQKGVYASVRTLTAFTSSGNKCGVDLGKTKVDTSNDFAVSKQIQMELEAKKAPIDVIASFEMGISQGVTTMLIKSVEFPKN